MGKSLTTKQVAAIKEKAMEPKATPASRAMPKMKPMAGAKMPKIGKA